MSKRKNNHGFTLIELVIAIAIMVTVSAAVAAMVTTVARHYKVSNTQTILSNEAANTVSQLNQMIMDATGTVAYSDAEKKLEIEYSGGTRDIYYDDSTMELTLFENGEDVGAIASYVSKFEVDDSYFKANRTISFKIEFCYDETTYATSFQASNRNETTSADSTVTEAAYFRVTPKEIYLEPNENYVLSCKLLGGSGDDKGKYSYTLMGSKDSTNTKITISSGYDTVLIQVGKNETGNDDGVMYLQLNSTKTGEDGNPEATTLITIRVRRVTAIVGSINLDSGTNGKAGSSYTVTAKVSGTNLEKAVGMSYDTNYIDPKQVKWSSDYKDGYVKVTSSSDTKFCFTLLKDLELDSTLTITMTALHPTGSSYNKSEKEYDDITYSVSIVVEKTGITINITEGIERNTDMLFGVFMQDMPSDIGYTLDEYNKIMRSCTKHWFYRFREVTENGYGDWVPFRATLEGGGQQKLCKPESLRLEPDKYYEIQFVYAVLNTRSHKVYYPLCSELLSAAGFEGYKAGWKSSQTTVALSDCTWTYGIAPASLTYEYYYDYRVWWPSYVAYTEHEVGLTYVGTSEYPKIINKSAYATIILTGKYIYDYANYINIILEYQDGSRWKTNTRYYIQHDSGIFRLNNMYNWNTGNYRILTYIQNWPVFGNGRSLFDTFNFDSYLIGTKNYELYDIETGDGMIYFQLN